MNNTDKIERSGPAPVIEQERDADSFVIGGAVGGSRTRAAVATPAVAPRAELRSRANVRFAFEIDDSLAA